MLERKCVICGRQFIARNKNEKYCKNIHNIECPICGATINLNTNLMKSRYAKNGFLCCSQKCAKKKMMLTNEQKYGYKTPMANPDIRKQIHAIQQTVEYKLKLGKSISQARLQFDDEKKQDIKNKIQETNLTRYGVKCPFQLPQTKRTMLNRYGVEYSGQSKFLLDKARATNLEKYGSSTPFYKLKLDSAIHDIIDNGHALKKFLEKIEYNDRTQTNVAKLLRN